MKCTCKICSPNLNTSDIIYNRPFVEVHAHSTYSSLDGTVKFKDYVRKLKEYNLPGMALTDHGNANGLFLFYNELKKNNLTPILGCEFYACTDKELRLPNSKREIINKDTHQSVFIKNKEGYRNFNRLHYLANTEGYYYKPRITFEELFHYKNGLIITTGCMVNIINQLNTSDFNKEAEEWFKRFLTEFGDNFYGEIQFNEILEKNKYGVSQKETNNKIIELCNKYDVPILIGGDVHYLEKGDDRLQDIVINVARNNDSGGESFIHARHLYFHNSEDIFEFNKKWMYNYCERDITKYLDNSLSLLDKINFEFETDVDNYPKFSLPKDKTSDVLIREESFNGLYNFLKIKKQHGFKLTKELLDNYKNRLNEELDVIIEKGFEHYFLIFQDLINHAKQNNIRVGPSRGSVGGSLLALVLGITDIDPLQHGLYFERFINKYRESKPDIDSDFSEGGKELVYDYLKNKYGDECVISVGTHQLYKAKRALQDASKGLGKDTSFQSVLMTYITKIEGLEEYEDDLVLYFNSIYKTTSEPIIKKWIEENKDVIFYANKLIGQVRQIGTHAGGVIITPGPMWNYFPVTRSSKQIVTAFGESDGSGKHLSELGILKLDILGLSSLSIIQNCVSEIKRSTGKDIENELRFVNIKDEKLLSYLRTGNVYSLFQLDGGAKRLVDSIQPESFEDVSLISALNRPGPLESFGDKVPLWKKKYKENKVQDLYNDPIYPKLDFMRDITKETYGVLLYQEQFMFMVQRASGMNLGECDNFRRCIAWKPSHPKYYQVEQYFNKLETNMLSNGYSKNDVKYFVEYCQKFLGYSFNKSHSFGYSYITFQMLYLKVYYPAYYYASLFRFEDKKKYTELVNDMVRNGVKLLSPRIDSSDWDFNTLDKQTVLMGFNVIKSFGDKAYNELIENQNKRKNLKDFLSIDFSKINKSGFESLLNTGCFDHWGYKRQYVLKLKELISEKKIQTWFTRKKNALELKTKPQCLNELDENLLLKLIFKYRNKDVNNNPWIDFIFEIIDYLKIDNEVNDKQELDDLFYKSTEFSIYYTHRLEILNNYREQLNNYNTFKKLDNSQDIVPFIVAKIEEMQSKKGKKYYQLEASDGTDVVHLKLWQDKTELKRNDICLGTFKNDHYGLSINLKEKLVILED